MLAPHAQLIPSFRRSASKNATRRLTFSLLLLITLLATDVPAATLVPLNYDMLNGNGQASGGSYNYWDKFYTGTGNTLQDNAPLSGGLGDLTDGFVTNQNWFYVENSAGTGPYVGWRNLNPVITFHFSGVGSYSQIDIHVDDMGYGGVSAPVSITVSDGSITNLFPVADPGFAGPPFWVDLDVSGLGLSGDTIFITLNRNTEWVFADEVQFLGTYARDTASLTTVPEPSSGMLFALGMLGVTVVTTAWRQCETKIAF